MIRLKPRREPRAHPERGARARDDADLRGNRDAIETRRQLRDRGSDLAGEAASGARDIFAGRGVIKEPFAQLADGAIFVAREFGAIEAVVDNPRHLVALVRNHRIVAQIVQRQIGQDHLGRDAFALGPRREARQLVAGARLVGAGQNLAHRIEAVGDPEKARGSASSELRRFSQATERKRNPRIRQISVIRDTSVRSGH